MREVGRQAETSSWPLLSRNANGFVSQFGEMRGLQMAGTPKKFELLPYTVGKLNTQPVNAGDPLNPSTDPGATFERRPFFVEGSGTFRFNMDCNDSNCTGLFYSRRIGRAPQG